MVKRRAVVVGIAEYQDEQIAELRYTLNDAARIAGVLENLSDCNFEVYHLLNSSSNEVIEALENACVGMGRGDLLFFYFAGHGVQQETTGQHLLLCKDARATILKSRATNGAVPHSYLEDITKELDCDFLFCFDACRSPVLAGSRSVGATMEGSRCFRDIGTSRSQVNSAVCWTIWSCADQQQAEERRDISGGIFTTAFVRTIQQCLKDSGGVVIEEAFMRLVVENMKRLGASLEQTPCHSVSPSGYSLTVIPCKAKQKTAQKKSMPNFSQPKMDTPPVVPVKKKTVSPPAMPKSNTRADNLPVGELNENIGAVSATENGVFAKLGKLGCLIFIVFIVGVVLNRCSANSRKKRLNFANLTTSRNRDVITVPECNIRMVFVEPGEFMMGKDTGYKGDCPAHLVKINQGYWIGQYEITQGQYWKVMGKRPSLFKGEFLPVESIKWSEAVEFCKRINKVESSKGRLPKGYLYRLPTEVEWEFAARGGTCRKYYLYSGSNTLADVAWYQENSQGKTQPVGMLLGNELGLFDMNGNVCEWCYESFMNDGQYQNRFAVDRGGSWNEPLYKCSTTMRYTDNADNFYSTIGFRIVLAPQLVK